MKKLMLGACALLSLAAVSCDKCCGDKCATANDSLADAYGQYVGAMIYSDFSNFDDNSNSAKQEFLKGLQLVAGTDESRNTQMGMQVGIQLMNEIRQLSEQGIELDKNDVINAFKKSFLADSLSFMDVQARQVAFRELFEKAQAEAAAAKEQAKGEEPIAVQNGMKAQKYIEDLKAENPAVQTTENGLSYIIEVPGVDPKPEATATVVVNYTGKHLNGEVFDSSEGRGPAEFPLQGVVPGFREGLMLLGKGGKATLYIPGDLAYGNNGQPQAGIEPNEMLIFEVELIDIHE